MNLSATEHVIAEYRRERRYSRPFEAARGIRDGWARYLAEQAIAGHDLAYAVEHYTVAARIYDAVCERAALGTPYADKNRRELFWSSGKSSTVRAVAA